MFLNGAVSRGRKGRDSLSGPHEREGTRHFDFSFVADTQSMDETFIHRADFAFLHPRPDVVANMFHGECGQFIRQTHTLDFLRRFDRTGFVQQRRGIYDFTGDLSEGIEENLRWCCRLAHHAVGGLCAHIEFNADLSRQAALFQDTDCRIKRAELRRPRIFFVVTLEQAEIFRPTITLRLRKLRFEGDQCRLAFTRENQSVIALHAPIIR